MPDRNAIGQGAATPGLGAGASAGTLPKRSRAVYGFAHRRAHHATLLRRQRALPLYIDDFNAALGLEPRRLLPAYFRLHAFLDRDGALEAQGAFADEPILKIGNAIHPLSKQALRDWARRNRIGEPPVDEHEMRRIQQQHLDRIVSWARFLQAERKKICIEAKLQASALAVPYSLRSLMPRERKKRDRFIVKNTSSRECQRATGEDFSGKQLYKLLEDFRHADSYARLEQKIRKYCRQDSDFQDDIRWLNDVIGRAFFRQTSKLGLEWFAKYRHEIGVDGIDFVLTHPQSKHKVLVEAAEARAYRLASLRDRRDYAEPITFSEYRHAQRKGIPITSVWESP